MRIGIDIRHLTDPHPAGVGGYTKDLLDALFRLDPVNEYVLFATGSPRALKRLPHFDAPNVKVKCVPVPNKLVNFWVMLTGFPLFENVDVWFFPNLNFIATKRPYVVMAHDLSFKIFPEFFTRKSRLWHRLVRPRATYQGASAIVCPSTSTKQDLTELYKIDEHKIFVTPLAATPASGTSIVPHLPHPFILSLGTLEPRKNHLSIIEAFEAYRRDHKDPISLVIAGGPGWKSRPVLRAIKRSPFAKEVHWTGYITPEQKADLYQRAAVLLFPSFYEGFGLPVLEAMAAGCPVITSNTSSIPELTQDAALLVDPFNVNDLTVALEHILSSKALRQELITKGIERAKEFSWEETARKTLAVLLQLK